MVLGEAVTSPEAGNSELDLAEETAEMAAVLLLSISLAKARHTGYVAGDVSLARRC